MSCVAIYIPTFNTKVFYQRGIGWEWGVVIGMTLVFLLWCEAWKVIRKPLYRRWTPKLIAPISIDDTKIV